MVVVLKMWSPGGTVRDGGVLVVVLKMGGPCGGGDNTRE